MLCSFSRLNSSPVITVRKLWIRPWWSSGPFIVRAGMADERVGIDESGGDRAEQLHLLAAHHVRASLADVGDTGNDRFALTRPDQL